MGNTPPTSTHHPLQHQQQQQHNRSQTLGSPPPTTTTTISHIPRKNSRRASSEQNAKSYHSNTSTAMNETNESLTTASDFTDDTIVNTNHFSAKSSPSSSPTLNARVYDQRVWEQSLLDAGLEEEVILDISSSSAAQANTLPTPGSTASSPSAASSSASSSFWSSLHESNGVTTTTRPSDIVNVSQRTKKETFLHPDVETILSLPLTVPFDPVNDQPSTDSSPSYAPRSESWHRSLGRLNRIEKIDPSAVNEIVIDLMKHFEGVAKKSLKAQVIIGRQLDRIEVGYEQMIPIVQRRNEDIRALLSELSQLSDIHQGLSTLTRDINRSVEAINVLYEYLPENATLPPVNRVVKIPPEQTEDEKKTQ